MDAQRVPRKHSTAFGHRLVFATRFVALLTFALGAVLAPMPKRALSWHSSLVPAALGFLCLAFLPLGFVAAEAGTAGMAGEGDAPGKKMGTMLVLTCFNTF